MGGLLILLALCVVMAVASFLSGALPLSMTLSQSQLRLISSIGIGVLVGTSLIVIIPEGIEAIASTAEPAHSHTTTPRHNIGGGRRIRSNVQWERSTNALRGGGDAASAAFKLETRDPRGAENNNLWVFADPVIVERDDKKNDDHPKTSDEKKAPDETDHGHDEEPPHLPTLYIGFSLILGFALMFLIDRLPRHATEQFQGSAPATRHISLDDLATSTVAGDDEEEEGFLGSLAPTPKQSRSLATTTGLVIHAAADGIAMGASATTADMKLGLIIFIAIMVHKAPAAFGLTSVLLKQGLSKRAARGHLIVFSLAAPFGALSTYMIISVIGGADMEGPSGQWWTGMLLLFSAGTFLYVAMHAMQEDNFSGGHDHHSNGYHPEGGSGGGQSQRKQTKPQMRDTLATVGGMLLPLLTQFGHHH
ncbi:ZIP zinc transporter-domain-containing protein [Apodospora peruviana]|uniref:ZIP zinc transporter-domain-containing protein n=1 Tax=Apodospora peruviana TaxID=516989 RepID=A0AAE0IC81_9PEZI|nr:ZIP zinc transporter-domain-containing protein [Apodospora peruviana]